MTLMIISYMATLEYLDKHQLNITRFND